MTEVIDSDERTIEIPDASLPDRLAAIERQVDDADEITRADVDAIQNELAPVIEAMREAVVPMLKSFNEIAQNFVDGLQPLLDDLEDVDE